MTPVQINKLKRIRDAVQSSKEKTHLAHERRRKKSSLRALGDRGRWSKAVRPESTRITVIDVKEWFDVRTRSIYGDDITIGPWTLAQRKLAKTLLDTYGSDLVRRAVDWVFDHWNEIQRSSRSRVGGGPTINVLWGYRESVFLSIQSKRDDMLCDPKNSDEFRDREGRRQIGW